MAHLADLADPATLPAALADFRSAYPAFDGAAVADAAGARVRPPRRAGPRLPRLHRRRPVRRIAAARAPGAAQQRRLRQPALDQPDLAGRHRRWPSGRAPPCSPSSTPRPTSTPSSSPPNASGALKLVGEAYPFAPGGRYLLSADNHNSVNGIREFARARGARDHLRAARRRRRCAWTRRALLAAARPGAGRAGAACSPTRPSPTSPASSTRSSGSRWPRRAAGTCCSTRPRSRRPTGSTWAAGSPTSSPLSFYKMFGYPTGVGCLIARASGAGRGCAGPGSPAARSPSPRSRATGTTWPRARPASRTARSTT